MSDTVTAQSTEAVARMQTQPEANASGAAPAATSPTASGQPQNAAAPDSLLDQAAPKAAEAYADFTLPGGVPIDSQSLTEAKQLFAADGLSQERAQSYVDLYAAKLKEATEAPYKLWADTQRDWQQAVKADREIGGAKLAGNLAIAAKAIERFGGDALRQALNVSGAGNHPDVIRAFIRIGKAISEDALVMGRGMAPDNRSRADRLYPNDPLKPRD